MWGQPPEQLEQWKRKCRVAPVPLSKKDLKYLATCPFLFLFRVRLLKGKNFFILHKANRFSKRWFGKQHFNWNLYTRINKYVYCKMT